jgi:PadR family transcriptional regulator
MAGTLGSFEQAVLLAIVRLADEAYGRTILEEVQAKLGYEVSAGAVQATLERLERKRLAFSRLGPGTPVRAGRPRRYFRATAAGLRALNDARATMETLWRGLAWPLKGRT